MWGATALSLSSPTNTVMNTVRKEEQMNIGSQKAKNIHNISGGNITIGEGGVVVEEINTNRCSPVEMRKNLVAVDGFKKAGIDFIPMPVLNEEDKKVLLVMMSDRLDKIEKASE